MYNMKRNHKEVPEPYDLSIFVSDFLLQLKEREKRRQTPEEAKAIILDYAKQQAILANAAATAARRRAELRAKSSATAKARRAKREAERNARENADGGS